MIKILFKIIGIILILLLLCVAGGVTFLYVKFPKMEPPAQITAQATPERIQRGDYLFHHVTLCGACHSARNEELYSVPMVAGTEGQGELFMKQKGFGALYAPNILRTPLEIGVMAKSLALLRRVSVKMDVPYFRSCRMIGSHFSVKMIYFPSSHIREH